MSGFLGTKAAPLYDVNLILQIIILIILVSGRKFAKDKKLIIHGRTMTTLLVLHTLAIVLIMIPSFITNFGALLTVSDPRAIITWIHTIVGSSVEVIGVYLVTKWRFQPKALAVCVKNKKFMKPTFILWGLSATLGIVFYLVYYL